MSEQNLIEVPAVAVKPASRVRKSVKSGRRNAFQTGLDLRPVVAEVKSRRKVAPFVFRFADGI